MIVYKISSHQLLLQLQFGLEKSGESKTKYRSFRENICPFNSVIIIFCLINEASERVNGVLNGHMIIYIPWSMIFVSIMYGRISKGPEGAKWIKDGLRYFSYKKNHYQFSTIWLVLSWNKPRKPTFRMNLMTLLQLLIYFQTDD